MSSILNIPESQVTCEGASEYHTMASAAGLLFTLRDENRKNKQQIAKEQHSQLEFVDKKTGEIKLHIVVF